MAHAGRSNLKASLGLRRSLLPAHGFRSSFRLGHRDLSGPGGVTIVPTGTALDERPGAQAPSGRCRWYKMEVDRGRYSAC